MVAFSFQSINCLILSYCLIVLSGTPVRAPCNTNDSSIDLAFKARSNQSIKPGNKILASCMTAALLPAQTPG